MSTVLEYTYDEEKPLSDKEALDAYGREKVDNPDALVVLDRLNCGVHWRVKTYKTKQAKEEFLTGKVRKIFNRVAKGIKP
jgi:hypothetical protein